MRAGAGLFSHVARIAAASQRSRYSSSLSLLSGPKDQPLIEKPMGEYFKSITSQYGDVEAIVSYHQRKRMTYHELDLESDKVLGGLLHLGVKHGERVGVCSGNTWEFAVFSNAIQKLGAIMVSLNPSLTPHQLTSALNHTTCSTLVITSFLERPNRPKTSSLPFIQSLFTDLQSSRLESELVPTLHKVILMDNIFRDDEHGNANYDMPGLTKFEDLSHGNPVPLPKLNIHDVINIQFTSGTTSNPKGASLSHFNLVNNGLHIGQRMNLVGGKDKVCIPVPVFHCFGLVLGNAAAWGTGSTVVYPAEAFNAKQTLRCVREEKCTALHSVPTMFVAMFEEKEEMQRGGFGTLRTGIAAGTNIPANLMAKIHKELNLTEQVISYGMTETSPVSAMTKPDDPLEKRLETVGQLMPHVDVKIVDKDGNILPIGQRGEICTAGYLLQKEYWNDPEMTSDAMRHDENGKRWMHTGDEGCFDNDGYLIVTGRMKDLIIR